MNQSRRSYTPIASPCVNICDIDEASGLCKGCLRSLDEIALWARLAPQQREAIMAALPARAGALPAGLPRRPSL